MVLFAKFAGGGVLREIPGGYEDRGAVVGGGSGERWGGAGAGVRGIAALRRGGGGLSMVLFAKFAGGGVLREIPGGYEDRCAGFASRTRARWARAFDAFGDFAALMRGRFAKIARVVSRLGWRGLICGEIQSG